MTNIIDVALLNSVLRFTAPILYASLGGLICQRVGIFNIALEGMMLVGAFAAVVGSYFTGNAFLGVMSGAVAGSLFGLLLALFIVVFKGHEVVVGVALNILAAGSTSFMLQVLLGRKGSFEDPGIVGLPKFDIPFLENIPILGPMLNDHGILIYLSLLFVILINILLFNHVIGLRMRGVGQHAEAARTLGLNINRLQILALVFCGILCGLGGAQLSIGNVTAFSENMSAGRGWIAIVAVMLGNAHPVGVFLTSTLFGFIDSLGFRFQAVGLPSELTGLLPYVVTLAAALAVQFRNQRRIAV